MPLDCNSSVVRRAGPAFSSMGNSGVDAEPTLSGKRALNAAADRGLGPAEVAGAELAMDTACVESISSGRTLLCGLSSTGCTVLGLNAMSSGRALLCGLSSTGCTVLGLNAISSGRALLCGLSSTGCTVLGLNAIRGVDCLSGSDVTGDSPAINTLM